MCRHVYVIHYAIKQHCNMEGFCLNAKFTKVNSTVCSHGKPDMNGNIFQCSLSKHKNLPYSALFLVGRHP